MDKPLRANQGALRFRCEYDQKKCIVRIRVWIASKGFDNSGIAEFDNEYISLIVTIAGKKGRGKTIEFMDFVTKPGQKRSSIHKYGDYELTVKQPCFEWFSETHWKTSRDEEIYIPPKTNLCIHPNPHHKVVPVGGVTKVYQGGQVNPR